MNNFEQVMFTILMYLIFYIVTSFIIKLAWNYTMPQVFGLSEISIGQGFAFLVLAHLLFGGPVSTFICASQKSHVIKY